MAVPSVYAAYNAVTYNSLSQVFYNAVVRLFFNFRPDMLTELTTSVGMVVADVVSPTFSLSFPYYDTIVFICKLVSSFWPIVSNVMTFLQMSTYAIIIGMPGLPLIGPIISPNQVDKITQGYHYLNNKTLDNGDVFFTAGLILCILTVVVTVIKWGTPQPRIILIRIPKCMETCSRVIWYCCLCGVGYCTILTQEQVENVLGDDSFYVFQVVNLVVVHIFSFEETASMDLCNGTTFHIIPGNLSVTGVKLSETHDMNALRRFLEKYIRSDSAEIWSLAVGDIDTNKGDEKKVALHREAKPYKNVLQSSFKSFKQKKAEKEYVLAFNCVPNTVAFPVFVFGILYFLASDGAKLLFSDLAKSDVQLYTIGVHRFFKDIKSNARGNGTSPVVFAAPVKTHNTHPKCPNTVDLKKTTTQKDAGNKENTMQQPPEANTTDEMPSDKVPDGSVQDADNTLYVAAGSALVSGVGYGFYWVMTQG